MNIKTIIALVNRLAELSPEEAERAMKELEAQNAGEVSEAVRAIFRMGEIMREEKAGAQ